jgi:hypothetical protein
MGMRTGEEGKGGVGVDRTGQEGEDQAGRIIETLRKLKAGAEERQQAYSTMEHYFAELGKCDFRPCGRVGGIIRCSEHPHGNGYRGKYKETTTTTTTLIIRPHRLLFLYNIARDCTLPERPCNRYVS